MTCWKKCFTNPCYFQQHCAREKLHLRIRFKPSLFQHVGKESSLKGKKQNLIVSAMIENVLNHTEYEIKLFYLSRLSRTSIKYCRLHVHTVHLKCILEAKMKGTDCCLKSPARFPSQGLNNNNNSVLLTFELLLV